MRRDHRGEAHDDGDGQEPQEIAADVRRAVAVEAMVDDLPGGHRQHQ